MNPFFLNALGSSRIEKQPDVGLGITPGIKSNLRASEDVKEVFMEVYTVEEFYCYDPKVCPPPKTKQVWCVNKYGVGRKDIFNYDFDIAWFPLPKVPDYLKQHRVEI